MSAATKGAALVNTLFFLRNTLPNRRFSVHVRWRFQHWRGWKILRPALILPVGDPHRKLKYTPSRQSILELFLFFLGQSSNISTPYLPLRKVPFICYLWRYFMDKLALKVHCCRLCPWFS